jgi:DNA primase
MSPEKSSRKKEPSSSSMAKRANCSAPNDVVPDIDPQRMALLRWLAKVAREIWNELEASKGLSNNDH